MGPYREHVDALVALTEQLGVSSFVEFRPPVPLNAVAAHLAEADVGLYTAIQDPHMSIAMPLKVLEYAAMGVPIIASRLKVLEEIFSDSAVLFFEPGDVEQFAGCVLTLYLQPERRAELARNAYDQFVACCSWRAEQQRYFELLNHLLPAGERLGAVAAKPQGKLWPEETA
jgi:glycosyltransferase involved in cell wall biosynthesis